MADEEFVDWVEVFEASPDDWHVREKSANGLVVGNMKGYDTDDGAIAAARAKHGDDIEVRRVDE